MRILIHDYAGHPFPFELSRALASRGHDVLHVFCSSLHTGPTGSFDRLSSDSPRFQMKPLALSAPLDKFSFIKRWKQENEYGKLAAAEVAAFRPDIVLSGNTPLDAQRRLWAACDSVNAKKVFWVQDLIGLATERILGKKLPLLGSAIGRHYINLEKRLLRSSDAVVGISKDFLPIFSNWKIEKRRTHVIENWAPIGKLRVCPKENAWSLKHGYADKFVFMYTGTMGMKHDPELIYDLALAFKGNDNVRIVVASKGLGATWLSEKSVADGLGNIDVIGFHPFDELPEALGAADVLLAVLEADADVYSVPSKVLAYLCANRPILLAVPSANLAARIVTDSHAGVVVEPGDSKGFVGAAESSYRDKALRDTMGSNGRTYAESHFDIVTITDTFLNIFEGVVVQKDNDRIDS